MKKVVHFLTQEKLGRTLVFALIVWMITLLLQSCAGSIKTEKYTADFEKKKNVSTKPYTGEKQTVQVQDLKTNKEL